MCGFTAGGSGIVSTEAIASNAPRTQITLTSISFPITLKIPIGSGDGA